MLRVYACIVQEHDLRLVVVAGVICLLASFIAFSSFEQALHDRSRRLPWAGLAAVVAGLGIWSTHFLAMLAYEPAVPIGYDLPVTLLSVAAAVLVTGIGWFIALARRRELAVVGGMIVGAGVGTMHYIGMSAVELAGFIVWDRTLVSVSVVLGMVLAGASVWAARSPSRRVAGLAPVLLTVAICGLHFTAMAAVVIYPSSAVTISAGTVNSSILAVEVTAAILLILLAGFGVLSFDRKLTHVRLAQAEQRAALADQIMQGAVEREDLTARLEREAAIRSAALENMVQGLAVYDADERLVVFNRRYAELYDLPASLLTPGTPFEAIRNHMTTIGTLPNQAEIRAQVEASDEGGVRYEVQLLNGKIIEAHRRLMPTGGWLSTHDDVTVARKSADEIVWLARHDALTGLPNRTEFAHRLASALADENSGSLAVLTIDLDRFKEVNDTLGHPFGDQILRDAASRLRAVVGEGDTITRLGGDEFAVIQTGLNDTDAPAALAGRIIDTLEQPFEFDGHTVVIGASVGIGLTPRDTNSAEDLLKMSDLALYRAKEESRGTFRFFEAEMDVRLRERRELEADLRVAIREGQFEVHYQPLLDLGAGTISCFEALVRWQHPARGTIQPNDFIPIAEDTSLIIPIGEWVLRQACRDAANWPEDVKVAVNLSPAQFKRGDLVAVTMNALAAAGLAPERLELEITESVLLHDEAWVRTVLDRLNALGVRIALDDFGTGYSSLSYLRSFPFTKIKIDRSFVAELAGTADSRAIVQATIQLSQKLGMLTTAEGVETAEQYEILASEGCTQAQGFHVSRPVPASGVEDLLVQYGLQSPTKACAAL